MQNQAQRYRKTVADATCLEIVDVVGYTQGEGKNSGLFGSLVMSLRGKYVGNVGGGFTDKQRRQLTLMLKKAPALSLSADFIRKVGAPFTPVKAPFQVEVTYQEVTRYGIYYAPRLKAIIKCNSPQAKLLSLCP